jgi:hypothetical protein
MWLIGLVVVLLDGFWFAFERFFHNYFSGLIIFRASSILPESTLRTCRCRRLLVPYCWVANLWLIDHLFSIILKVFCLVPWESLDWLVLVFTTPLWYIQVLIWFQGQLRLYAFMVNSLCYLMWCGWFSHFAEIFCSYVRVFSGNGQILVMNRCWYFRILPWFCLSWVWYSYW